MDMNDGNGRTAKPARRKIAILFATGLALAATPALSQGAMGPGGGAMTPQPRVAPAPQAPAVTPQAPPQMPIAAPIPSTVQPGPTKQSDKAKAATGDYVNVESSNRDHLTTGPAKPMPNYSNNPIPGIDVVVRKKPAGNAIPTAKTDGTGQATFRQLEPGTYEVALPKVPDGGTVSLTTFVNGVPASRTDFPVGSSVGTFTVAKAGDTVILKFQTNLGSTPTNGVGGVGGGRLQTDTSTTPTNGIGGVGGGRLPTDTSTTPTNGIGVPAAAGSPSSPPSS